MKRKEFLYLLNYINEMWSLPDLGMAPESNKPLIKEAISSWVSLTLDISPTVSLNTMLKWLNYLSTVTFEDIMLDCKLLSSVVVRMDVSTFTAFKGQAWKTKIMKLTLPIEGLIIDFLVLGRQRLEIYQWARYLIKLEVNNPTLNEQALQLWKEVDDSLREPTVIPSDREIYYFSRPFRNAPDRSQFRPHHGGGRVAEKGALTLFDKYCMSRPVKPLYGLYSSRWQYPPVDPKATMTSRLVFVSKTVFARRSVAMEPAALMWYQQGWKPVVYSLIESCSDGAISFDDQRQNMRLAKFGSLHDCTYATIDFSSASDTLSYTAVVQLLRDAHPMWKRILLEGRSTHCELPTGEVIKMNKYAPMGSCFCFPLETLFFYCIAASMLEKEYGSMHFGPEISIYGDDCILPVEIAVPFMERCKEFGFRPNADKSYWSGPFRESCGCDVINGEVITPLYYRVPSPPDPDRNNSVVALANHAHLRGYKHVREHAITLARDGTGFSQDPESGTCIYTPDPWTSKTRRDKDYQIGQIQTYVPHERGARRCAYASEVLLQEWLRIREYTDPDDMPVLDYAIPPVCSETLRWVKDPL